MPTYRTGDMFAHIDECDRMYVTTNATLRKDGALVMGRGAALQAKKYNPTLPYRLGSVLKGYSEGAKICDGLPIYGLIHYTCLKIAGFQVKYHYRDRADLALIVVSSMMLRYIASNRRRTLFLNFPGIGNGGLDIEDVKPYLDIYLPDNVHVWSLE